MNTHHFAGSTGGNLEGKEQRFGIANSALWTAVTTVTSCGAVNAARSSRSPGSAARCRSPNLSMSEVVFGGVGTGLYSMLLFVLLAVFIGGLMVGRTPEYLGKKIGAREIKLVSLGALFTPLAVLMTSAAAIASPAGRKSIAASGPQGFSENLYAYLSQANNNGSAWAGYTGYVQPNPATSGAHGVAFADLLGGLTMMFARYAPILFVLAVAGALAGKKVAPAGLGTMRTDTPTFVVLLIGVIVLVGALTVLPRHPARPDRPEPDHQPLLMRRDLITSVIAVVVLTVAVRRRLPAGRHRRLPGRLPGRANGSKIERNGKVVGSRLIGQDFRKPVLDERQAEGRQGRQPGADARPALLPGAAVHGHQLRRRRHRVHQPGAQQQGRARHLQGQPRSPTSSSSAPTTAA